MKYNTSTESFTRNKYSEMSSHKVSCRNLFLRQFFRNFPQSGNWAIIATNSVYNSLHHVAAAAMVHSNTVLKGMILGDPMTFFFMDTVQ